MIRGVCWRCVAAPPPSSTIQQQPPQNSGAVTCCVHADNAEALGIISAAAAQVVLSHYPASSEDLNDKEVPRICNSTWLEDVGVWRLWEAENQLPLGQFVPVCGLILQLDCGCQTRVARPMPWQPG